MESGPAWATFAAIAALVALALVSLARLTEGSLGGEATGGVRDRHATGRADPPRGTEPRGGDAAHETAPDAGATAAMSPGLLLVNVALSQGVLASLLVLGAWYARIPPAALGVGPGAVGAGALAIGTVAGVALYAADEALAFTSKRAGVEYSEELRRLLAPDSARGWIVLLVGVLPMIAGFEELLFRGVLVGAFAAGFPVSPWLLAAASSVVFGVAHGAQGAGGMVVTGVLGFSLAAAFVLTESLLVVVVAHYLVNALEFVVHEGLGVSWQ